VTAQLIIALGSPLVCFQASVTVNNISLMTSAHCAMLLALWSILHVSTELLVVTYFSYRHLLTNRKYYHNQEVSSENGRKRENCFGFVADTGQR